MTGLHRRWTAALGLLLVAASAAAAPPPQVVRGSAAWDELARTPVTAQAPLPFHAVAVLEGWSLTDEAATLRRQLVWLHLRQAAGEATAPSQVQHLMGNGGPAAAPDALQAAHSAALNHSLQDTPLPTLPADQHSAGFLPVGRAGSGLWHQPPDGLLAAHWQVRNTGPRTLAHGPIALWIEAGGAGRVHLDCKPVGAQKPLAPGQVAAWWCTTEPGYGVLRAFRGEPLLRTGWLAKGPLDAYGTGPVTELAEQLADPSEWQALAAFRARNAGCGRRGTCLRTEAAAGRSPDTAAERRHATQQAAQAKDEAAVAQRIADRKRGWRNLLWLAAGFLTGLLAYVFAARALGRLAVNAVLALAGLGLALAISREMSRSSGWGVLVLGMFALWAVAGGLLLGKVYGSVYRRWFAGL